MHDSNNDIERIINKGFCQLPVNERVIVQAIDEVVHRSKSNAGEKLATIPFRHSTPVRLFTIAAALVLSVGVISLLNYQMHLSTGKPVAQNRFEQKIQLDAELISFLRDTGVTTAPVWKKNNRILTDKHSQLLLAVGKRTKTILFEESSIQVDKADSVRTSIFIDKGTVAVDVTPGGRDTVSIVTAFGSFVQLGTRFSVSVDSIRGAILEVYRGSVLIRGTDGFEITLVAGQAWRSSNGNAVTELLRDTAELEELGNVFSGNRLKRLLRFESEISGNPNMLPKKRLLSRQTKKQGKTALLIDKTFDNFKVIRSIINSGDIHAIDSVVAGLDNPSVADTIAGMLLALVQRKKDYFNFDDAQRLLDIVINGKPFTVYRREGASVQRYLMHKTLCKKESSVLLKELQDHRLRFAGGSFGEDIAAEIVELLISMKKHDQAIVEIQQLLRLYPHHPQNDYYRYLRASVLRDNLHRNTEALEEYKLYVTSNPQGKFVEDALYWIIQLCKSAHDRMGADKYTKLYLQLYPRGRWIGEVRIDGLVKNDTGMEDR